MARKSKYQAPQKKFVNPYEQRKPIELLMGMCPLLEFLIKSAKISQIYHLYDIC